MAAPEQQDSGGYPRYNPVTDDVEWVDNPPIITAAIHAHAAAANAAANECREAIDQQVAGMPSTANRVTEATVALLAAVDTLTTAICDAEA